MIKRIVLLTAVVVSTSLFNGCFTLLDDDWDIAPFNSHNVKIVNKMFDDLHEAHRDFDMFVFGIDTDEE